MAMRAPAAALVLFAVLPVSNGLGLAWRGASPKLLRGQGTSGVGVAHPQPAPAASFLELGATLGWSGWGPKMKSSFDVETHTWKPPWFHDGVQGYFVEPFPSYIWLNNGLAVPLMHADKYFFKREDLEDMEKKTAGKGRTTNKPTPDDGAKQQQQQEEDEKARDPDSSDDDIDKDVPEEMAVDGVPVPAARGQYEQMKKYHISKKQYVPGSIVGQKIFNDWWRSVHTDEGAPDTKQQALTDARFWFIPHAKEHFSMVKDSWKEYFAKLLGLNNDAKESRAPDELSKDDDGHTDQEAEAGRIQNTDVARRLRHRFEYRPMPSGECFNIGSGVYCTPIIRDKSIVPLESSVGEGENAIAERARQLKKR